jgi:hypothetical protein
MGKLSVFINHLSKLDEINDYKNFANPSSAAEVNKNEEGIHQLLIRGPTWWPTDALGQMMIKLLAA